MTATKQTAPYAALAARKRYAAARREAQAVELRRQADAYDLRARELERMVPERAERAQIQPVRSETA
jgi:hypothetical protein